MKKRVLILGASGMLGHTLFRLLAKNDKYVVGGTLRAEPAKIQATYLQDHFVKYNCDANFIEAFEVCIDEFKPNVVINCIGAIKQIDFGRKEANYLNSLFSHKVAALAAQYNFRLIHFSTDCVFSGAVGNYSENDTPDAVDFYGWSKFQGEVTGPGCLTLRTSIIGHELNSNVSLVDWFLNQNGTVNGFSNAYFSGYPTVFVSKVVERIIDLESLSGLYHLASNPISKYDLLLLVKKYYRVNTYIVEEKEFEINRSLNGSALNSVLNLASPSWDSLVEMMYKDYLDFKANNNTLNGRSICLN